MSSEFFGLRARLGGAAGTASDRPPVRPGFCRPPATMFGGVSAIFLAGLVLSGCQGSDDGALSVVISLPAQQLPPAAKATLLVDYSGTGARLKW